MDRLTLAAIKCNYKEKDIQLKYQFIHGLNYNDMLEEIIIELNKIKKDSDVAGEQVLVWVK